MEVQAAKWVGSTSASLIFGVMDPIHHQPAKETKMERVIIALVSDGLSPEPELCHFQVGKEKPRE